MNNFFLYLSDRNSPLTFLLNIHILLHFDYFILIDCEILGHYFNFGDNSIMGKLNYLGNILNFNDFFWYSLNLHFGLFNYLLDQLFFNHMLRNFMVQINVFHDFNLFFPFFNNWHLFNDLNFNYSFCLYESINTNFNLLGNLNNLFNNSWHNNDFFNDFLDLNNLRYFNHFFNNFIDADSDLFYSLDCLSYWYYFFNLHLNLNFLIDIVNYWLLNFHDLSSFNRNCYLSLNFNNFFDFNFFNNHFHNLLRNKFNSFLNNRYLDYLFNLPDFLLLDINWFFNNFINSNKLLYFNNLLLNDFDLYYLRNNSSNLNYFFNGLFDWDQDFMMFLEFDKFFLFEMNLLITFFNLIDNFSCNHYFFVNFKFFNNPFDLNWFM